MLPLCTWSVHLSEFRFNRWQAGASDEHFIATGRALRSWLWLDIDHICGTFSLYIMPTGSLSQLAILSGEYPNKYMSFYEIDEYIIFVLQCFCAIALFYCAHWQTYVSGTMRFGKIDVTEAQFSIIAIHMVSAILGPEIWLTKVSFICLIYFGNSRRISHLFKLHNIDFVFKAKVFQKFVLWVLVS